MFLNSLFVFFVFLDLVLPVASFLNLFFEFIFHSSVYLCTFVIFLPLCLLCAIVPFSILFSKKTLHHFNVFYLF